MRKLSLRKKKVDLPFEESNDIKKLALYIVIVSPSISKQVISILKDNESNLQFVQKGRGTAPKDIVDILGISDTSKDVIYSLVKLENLDNVKTSLNGYFATTSKANKGIGFGIPLTSIIGISIYKMLVNM